MWTAWHAQQAGARGAHRPARVRTGLRPRPERPQRRLLRGDVDLARLDARALGRRAGARRRPARPRRRSTRIAAFCARGGRRRLVPPGGYLAGLDDARPRRRPAATRSRPAASSASPTSCARSPPPRSRRRCASPEFRAGVDRTRRRDRPARPPRARPPPPPARGGRRDLRVLAGAPLPRGAPTGSRRRSATGARVRAPRGVLAIGAAAKGRGGPLRGRLTVASSHIVITEPVPDVIEKIGWTGGEAITDGRALVHYFRTTPDGRIAFGWGGGRIAMGARLHGRTEVDADVVAAAAPPPARILPRPRAAAASPTPGAARSTPRRPTSPRSPPCPAAAPGSRPATPATASARPTWSASPSPPSPSTARDDPTRLAFVDPKTPRVPPEPFHWIGGEAIRARHRQQGGRRARGPPPRAGRLRCRQGAGADRLPHRALGDGAGVPPASRPSASFPSGGAVRSVLPKARGREFHPPRPFQGSVRRVTSVRESPSGGPPARLWEHPPKPSPFAAATRTAAAGRNTHRSRQLAPRAPQVAAETGGSGMTSSCSGRMLAIRSARRCCQVVKAIAATVIPKRIIAMQLTSTGTPRWKAPKM